MEFGREAGLVTTTRNTELSILNVSCLLGIQEDIESGQWLYEIRALGRLG